MSEENRNRAPEKLAPEEENTELSATWAQDIIEDMDDFIETQGIYLRQ